MRSAEASASPVSIRDLPDGELEFASPDGEVVRYYPGRTLYLSLENLQERFSSASLDDGHAEPWLSHYLSGTGSLQRDFDISVLGAPETRVSHLPVCIRAAAPGGLGKASSERKGQRPVTDYEFAAFASSAGLAQLGFSAADREVGTKDAWWLELLTSEEIFQGLIQAVRERRLTNLAIGLHDMKGLYTTEHTLGPLNSRGHLVLRPSRHDPGARYPEPANGAIGFLHAGLEPLSLSSPDQQEDSDQGSQAQSRASAPASQVPVDLEPLLTAARRLEAYVASLRAPLVWLAAAGWAAAGAILLIGLLAR